MTPYYEQDGITIYHGDCREALPDLQFNVVVTDPPYGIQWNPRVNHQDAPWLDTGGRPDLSMLGDVPMCVWGGNYFTDCLPPTEAWLIWIKRPVGYDFDDDGRAYSVIELAWTNFGGKPKMRHHCWDGGKRAGHADNRMFCHPAQKPLEIMAWCLKLAPPGVVLDPFMGSGTTLRAAKNQGRKAIGIEAEEQYCEIAAKRLAQRVLPLETA